MSLSMSFGMDVGESPEVVGRWNSNCPRRRRAPHGAEVQRLILRGDARGIQ